MKHGRILIACCLSVVAWTACLARAEQAAENFWHGPTVPEASRAGLNLAVDRPIFVVSSGGTQGRGVASDPDRTWRPPVPADKYRLPGEFERQAALLMGCCELVRELPNVFAEIIEATRGSVEIVALVNDRTELDLAKTVLADHMVAGDEIRYVEVPHNTMWARDYGPVVVERDGKPSLIDAMYSEVARPEDDQVPSELAGRLDLPVIRAPISIEGGNLLSNGQGLCVATDMLILANAARVDERGLRRWLERLYGAKQTVFLEPLAGESTAHVDMFATFTSADTIVVGEYDPAVDPENAEILDRNAERLSEVVVSGRYLQVVRIPMPSHDDGVWRTYTNVAFANGVLLVPVYLGVDERGRRSALETYQQLLPGWRVVGIEAGKLIECAGALHCITMNLGPLGRIPNFSRPTRKEKPNSASPIPADIDIPVRLSGFGD